MQDRTGSVNELVDVAPFTAAVDVVTFRAAVVVVTTIAPVAAAAVGDGGGSSQHKRKISRSIFQGAARR